MKVLVTGASGLSAARSSASSPSLQASMTELSTRHSRATPPLRKLDLLDDAAVASLFDEVRPKS